MTLIQRHLLPDLGSGGLRDRICEVSHYHKLLCIALTLFGGGEW